MADELFNILAASARIDKSKRKSARRVAAPNTTSSSSFLLQQLKNENDNSTTASSGHTQSSRDRTGKRDTSLSKKQQVHRENVAAFRRSLSIRISSNINNTTSVPDPVTAFEDLFATTTSSSSNESNQAARIQEEGETTPNWASTVYGNDHSQQQQFVFLARTIQRNCETWKTPTAVQMQAIPVLLSRRDLLACAPTGSGKTGAFLWPALLWCRAPTFYQQETPFKKNKKKKQQQQQQKKKPSSFRRGDIRCLVLAPSHELAVQLHRQVQKLSHGTKISSLLLAKANSAQVLSGSVGGANGLDVLVSTPLRVVDAVQKGLRLDAVRFVVLDEADRLLDATEDNNNNKSNNTSRSFLAQMDIILSQLPITSIRALFSATISSHVRSLAENFLRNPVDFTVAARVGAANPDIDQRMLFVGREQGKLLAIRQLLQRGEFQPPALLFVDSQERAQALFGELLYFDGLRVDVVHGGRSKAAREKALAQFRKGEVWLLIATDLVARGVDLAAVRMVINYDVPTSGTTYVHRIGRTGRAGRKGVAITMVTEADVGNNLRAIANIVKQSGCNVNDWMLKVPLTNKRGRATTPSARRTRIDTTPKYDIEQKRRKDRMVRGSKRKKKETTEGSSVDNVGTEA